MSVGTEIQMPIKREAAMIDLICGDCPGYALVVALAEVERLKSKVNEIETDYDRIEVKICATEAEVERLRELVAKKGKLHSGALAEVERLRARCRTAAQTIIECIGADGPENFEMAAVRVVAVVERLKEKLDRQGRLAVGLPIKDGDS